MVGYSGGKELMCVAVGKELMYVVVGKELT